MKEVVKPSKVRAMAAAVNSNHSNTGKWLRLGKDLFHY